MYIHPLSSLAQFLFVCPPTTPEEIQAKRKIQKPDKKLMLGGVFVCLFLGLALEIQRKKRCLLTQCVLTMLGNYNEMMKTNIILNK